MPLPAARPAAAPPDPDTWPGIAGTPWTKSTFSGTGNCVEVAVTPQHVMVRDSKDPQGPMLAFTPDEWDSFLKGVRHGQFTRGRLRARARAWARRTGSALRPTEPAD